jgi:hypothetical protein
LHAPKINKNAHMLNKVSTKAIAKGPPSFLKQLDHMTYKISTLSFGMLGSHNDINVLQQSPLFARLCACEARECSYTINGHDYNMVVLSL